MVIEDGAVLRRVPCPRYSVGMCGTEYSCRNGRLSCPWKSVCVSIFSTSEAGTMVRRKTCKRYNTSGEAHALTFSCFRRQAFLSKDRSRQWLIDGISRACEKRHYHVWAYVIMPEHAHLLVWPTVRVYNISDFLNSIKQSVAKTALAYVR